MIVFDSVVKRRGERHVLAGISCEARPGRVTGFLGANGAGKSSALRILLGLDRATSGRALIDGVPYARLRDPMRTVGAVLDGSGAHRSRTGRAHLRWLAHAAGVPVARVAEVMADVGLAEAAGQRVGSYSLGMGRRLGVAVALLGDPPVLVLDEPVNGLDPQGIRWLRNMVRSRAAQGHTVLLSSHLMAELEETADDIVIIDRGRIVAQGTLTEVTGAHRTLESAYFHLTRTEDGQ
ncbi:ABC transporter ATP-binding protein [Streptomyces celluloflavus]|uniref:ABC transporter ATP-binding protein n=1 Tax=Streptomyces celluloflavus TaxID=58344 RepID=A0ABW7RLB1_9ACTN|nr:ATP-binding cassette domain-containing protein [Streptomyces celluloflavus]